MWKHKTTSMLMVAMVLLLNRPWTSYGNGDLSREEVQEAAQQGFHRADREMEKHRLQRAQSEGTITQGGGAQLHVIDDLNQQYDRWKERSKKAGDVAERARRVRTLQYKLAEIANSNDFAAPRKRAMWNDEMRYLTKQPPELPDLPPLP